VRVDDSGFRKRMANLPIIFGQEAEDVMLQLGKIGEEEMRRSIKDAPTPFARIRSKVGLGPPQGRARSYSMYRSVGSKLRSGARKLQIAVGYLKGPKRDYYTIQDGSDSKSGGFRNKWRFVGFGPASAQGAGPNAPNGFLFAPATTRITEGTHALRNAREVMLNSRKKVFAPAEKRIAKRFNATARGGKGGR
jgi:hypothetical protein